MRKHIIGSYTSVIGIHLPGVVWQFTLLWGLAFGLESAVVNFNRWPMLAIAANRCCTCAVTAACFDGEVFVDFLIRHHVSGPGLRCIPRVTDPSLPGISLLKGWSGFSLPA